MMSQYTLQPLNCKLSLFLPHSCSALSSLRLILFVICSLLQFGTVDCSREMISKPSKPTGSDQPSPHTPIANPWTSIVRTQPEEVIIVKPRGVDDRMRRESRLEMANKGPVWRNYVPSPPPPLSCSQIITVWSWLAITHINHWLYYYLWPGSST